MDHPGLRLIKNTVSVPSFVILLFSYEDLYLNQNVMSLSRW